MARVAAIGECMIELAQDADGRFVRGFGGDTLNTAIYLARLGHVVDYATALGDDEFSQDMKAAWAHEGLGLGLVLEAPGRLPGLYLIKTNAHGERRFSHWRDSAPARQMFELPRSKALAEQLASYELVYISGITLQILGVEGRMRLRAALDAAHNRGAKIAFDTNFRVRGWPDLKVARCAYRSAIERADIIFASTEDLDGLKCNDGNELSLERELANNATAEIIYKLDSLTVRVAHRHEETVVKANPIANVVDTTAAGDSFAAGYLAARLDGRGPVEAARAGHSLAGVVVQHRGAIIPKSAMPTPATRDLTP